MRNDCEIFGLRTPFDASECGYQRKMREPISGTKCAYSKLLKLLKVTVRSKLLSSNNGLMALTPSVSVCLTVTLRVHILMSIEGIRYSSLFLSIPSVRGLSNRDSRSRWQIPTALSSSRFFQQPTSKPLAQATYYNLLLENPPAFSA